MLVDYHTHLLGHLDRYITEENVKEFLQAAGERGIKKLGVSDHNRFHEEFDFATVQKAAAEFPQLEVKAGIEMDYTPGEETEISQFLDQFNLDYVIGSIHYLGDWMFDNADYKEEYQNWDIDELYKEYFNYVKQSAQSGLFDILGHLDLIKVFDFRPEQDVLEIVNPVLEVIAAEDQVIEINTNGLNKPVGEIYPSRKILEQAYDKEVKVTLGSDAHSAQRVGENLAEMREMLLDIGYREVATFSNHQRKMVEL